MPLKIPRPIPNPTEMVAAWGPQLAARLNFRPPRSFRPPQSPRLCYGRHQGPPPVTARQAAVLLVCMAEEENQWSIPLVVRTEGYGHHAGQVALPGGKLDPGETPQEAALREFFEETGAVVQADQIVGELPPIYVFASNFHVRSFVAVAPQRLTWQPCPQEVASVLHLPISRLIDAGAYGRHKISRRGLSFSAPHLKCEDKHVWGATLWILGQFAEALSRQSDPAAT